ncbi:MAG TPA: hypothetical protein VJR29_03600 [bacterium]|nr:hypothetical protein [bacterium]
MNNRMSRWTPLWLLLAILSACGSVPNKGIEVGNPDLKGKVLTLTPKERPETFLLDFAEDGSVAATRILENEFETVPATLETAEAFAQVTATFGDGTDLDAQLFFDDSGQLSEATLALDGQPVELESSVLNPKALRQPDFKLAALGVAERLCARLTECGAEADAGSCTETILDVPGLAPSLGGSGGQSLREMQVELDSGELEAVETSLESCFWEISQMPCAQAQKARPPSNPQIDLEVRQMIPRPSCSSGFRATSS